MTESERDVAESLRQLDHALPQVTAEDVIARAGSRSRRRVAPLAAAAVLFVAAVAAALPFTPAYEAIRREIMLATGRTKHSQVAPPAPAPHGAGVAIVPGTRLRITFIAPPSGSRVRLTTAPAGQALLVPEDGDAAFAIHDEAIVVSDITASTFAVTVPQSVEDLIIETDGRPLLQRHGAVVTTDAPRGDGESYLLELKPRAP